MKLSLRIGKSVVDWPGDRKIRRLKGRGENGGVAVIGAREPGVLTVPIGCVSLRGCGLGLRFLGLLLEAINTDSPGLLCKSINGGERPFQGFASLGCLSFGLSACLMIRPSPSRVSYSDFAEAIPSPALDNCAPSPNLRASLASIAPGSADRTNIWI